MCKTSFASIEAHGPTCQHVKLSKSEDILLKLIIQWRAIAFWLMHTGFIAVFMMECGQILLFADFKDQ